MTIHPTPLSLSPLIVHTTLLKTYLKRIKETYIDLSISTLALGKAPVLLVFKIFES